MKRPQNRMETPEVQGEVLLNRDEIVPSVEEPNPKTPEVRGIPCKYCGEIGKNEVAKTYGNRRRIRICHACHRRFETQEFIS